MIEKRQLKMNTVPDTFQVSKKLQTNVNNYSLISIGTKFILIKHNLILDKYTYFEKKIVKDFIRKIAK